MKVYRLVSNDKMFNLFSTAFFSPVEEDMKKEVSFRNEDEEEPGWSYKEDEVPDKEIGICWNNFPNINTPSLLTAERESSCSVGLVRMDRSGNRKRTDDISEDALYGCSQCPYFISYTQLTEIVKEQNMGRDNNG